MPGSSVRDAGAASSPAGGGTGNPIMSACVRPYRRTRARAACVGAPPFPFRSPGDVTVWGHGAAHARTEVGRPSRRSGLAAARWRRRRRRAGRAWPRCSRVIGRTGTRCLRLLKRVGGRQRARPVIGRCCSTRVHSSGERRSAQQTPVWACRHEPASWASHGRDSVSTGEHRAPCDQTQGASTFGKVRPRPRRRTPGGEAVRSCRRRRAPETWRGVGASKPARGRERQEARERIPGLLPSMGERHTGQCAALSNAWSSPWWWAASSSAGVTGAMRSLKKKFVHRLRLLAFLRSLPSSPSRSMLLGV